MISEKFPEGLRVLVFDEDPEYLRILDKHLQSFQYQVTICDKEERVMDLLRKDRFDIAIIDVSNSEGDRFRLISEIGSEMINLPIIIISKDESVDSIINWMRNGACDYLVKPIRPEDLRLIFKHLVKKPQVGRTMVPEDKAVEKSSSVGTSRNPNKRKRSIYEDDHDRDSDGHDPPSTSKKRRVVWDELLNKTFMEAMEYFGPTKAVPKKILEYMIGQGITGITRENVASHLQKMLREINELRQTFSSPDKLKYRMNIKKQNEQNEGKENNSNLITTAQEAIIYSDQEAADFYIGGNVHFQPHQINNTHQPYVNHQADMNPNLTTQLISPLEHRHHLAHGVSVEVFGGNAVMAHHYHQTSELAYIENTGETLGYNNFETYNEDEDDGIKNWTNSFSQNPQEVSLFDLQEPIPNCLSTSSEVNPQQMMNIHETQQSMLHFPSFPSSYTHSSFRDKPEILDMVDQSGGLHYDHDYPINNKK